VDQAEESFAAAADRRTGGKDNFFDSARPRRKEEFHSIMLMCTCDDGAERDRLLIGGVA